MERIIDLLVKIALAPENPQGANQRMLYRKSLESAYAEFLATKKLKDKMHLADVDHHISEMLLELGTPSHLSGYDYLQSAIELLIQDPRRNHLMTLDVYPTVANQFGTTPSRVERAIRHAIEATMDRGDLEVFHRVFGNTISSRKGKPTNSEFICGVARYIRTVEED